MQDIVTDASHDKGSVKAHVVFNPNYTVFEIDGNINKADTK